MRRNDWSLERLRRESSYWRSCTIITAGQLGLCAWIGKRQKDASELAAHFGGTAACWEIFCNALCAMGLLRKRAGKFANTSFSLRYLNASGASFLLPEYDAWKTWGGLASALRSGKRPKTNNPFFSDQNKARRLLEALDVDGQKIARHLVQKLPLNRSKTLLDIGGGLGAFSIAFCRRFPNLQATLVEHPRTVSFARHNVARAGLSKRIRVAGVNFASHDLPRGFDAVFVSNILHSQSINQNRSLLLKLRDCLKPEGYLILRDVFMSRDRIAPEWATLFSLSLLLHTPEGRCYALEEILNWLRRSGFSRIKGPFPSSRLAFDPNSILIARTV
jgi:predicted O-methyltransferase YrrM